MRQVGFKTFKHKINDVMSVIDFKHILKALIFNRLSGT